MVWWRACGTTRDSSNYGPTVILRHELPGDAAPWYTLYGHLDEGALALEPGTGHRRGRSHWRGRRGTRINGGWAPHLHLQIIADRVGLRGGFPRRRATQRARHLAVDLARPQPDPRLPGRVSRRRAPLDERTLLAARRQWIGPSLSIAYRTPLTIVRGHMQYLYDVAGRRYLDVVNNVAHVGHCHPHVVAAVQRQAAVLNTNTRYLHPAIERYAERLTAQLPAPLSVCFFVCSGSEANELALRLAHGPYGAPRRHRDRPCLSRQHERAGRR